MLLSLVILVEKQKNSLKNGSYPLRRNCIDTKQEFVAIAGRKDLEPTDKQKKYSECGCCQYTSIIWCRYSRRSLT